MPHSLNFGARLHARKPPKSRSQHAPRAQSVDVSPSRKLDRATRVRKAKRHASTGKAVHARKTRKQELQKIWRSEHCFKTTEGNNVTVTKCQAAPLKASKTSTTTAAHGKAKGKGKASSTAAVVASPDRGAAISTPAQGGSGSGSGIFSPSASGDAGQSDPASSGDAESGSSGDGNSDSSGDGNSDSSGGAASGSSGNSDSGSSGDASSSTTNSGGSAAGSDGTAGQAGGGTNGPSGGEGSDSGTGGGATGPLLNDPSQGMGVAASPTGVAATTAVALPISIATGHSLSLRPVSSASPVGSATSLPQSDVAGVSPSRNLAAVVAPAVVGSILGLALVALAVFCGLGWRRRRQQAELDRMGYDAGGAPLVPQHTPSPVHKGRPRSFLRTLRSTLGFAPQHSRSELAPEPDMRESLGPSVSPFTGGYGTGARALAAGLAPFEHETARIVDQRSSAQQRPESPVDSYVGYPVSFDGSHEAGGPYMVEERRPDRSTRQTSMATSGRWG